MRKRAGHNISIHALREEGDVGSSHHGSIGRISIHALREEGDYRIVWGDERRRGFLSTPSARRATHPAGRQRQKGMISIHALREEGDANVCHGKRRSYDFYPRPPRGGRRKPPSCMTIFQTFLSTPSARRATGRSSVHDYAEDISIHALREEGDRTRPTRASSGWNFYPRPPRGGRRRAESLNNNYFLFLSTPSARRATLPSARTAQLWGDFYPRPPRGGRPHSSGPQPSPWLISIHALREEGDRCRLS